MYSTMGRKTNSMADSMRLKMTALLIGTVLTLPMVLSAQCFQVGCSITQPSAASTDYQVEGLYLNATASAPLPGGPTAPSETFYVRLVANRGTGSRDLITFSFLYFYNPLLADEPAFGRVRQAENLSEAATISVSTAPIPEGMDPQGGIDARFTDNLPGTTHYKVIEGNYDICLPLLPASVDAGGPYPTDNIVRIKFVTKAGFVGPFASGLKDNPNSGSPLLEACDSALRANNPTPAFHAFNNNQLLAVDLISFQADALGIGNPVNLTWETSAEIDNVGFNVYRANPVGSFFTPGEKLNASFIPAAGDATSGASYSLLDEKPLNAGEVRSYYLEDLDLNGVSTMHGPVSTDAIGGSGGDTTAVSDWRMYDF